MGHLWEEQKIRKRVKIFEFQSIFVETAESVKVVVQGQWYGRI